MIELEAHFGRERVSVGNAELQRVLQADGVVVEPGDMVCLHTGFAQLLLEMDRKPDPRVLNASCCVLDGHDPALLQWITDCGLAVLVADNYAVESASVLKADAGSSALPLHEHCLFKLGVNLGELWYLSDLAAWLREHGRSRFLLNAPPLRLAGAIGSPVMPVGTV